MKIDKLQMRIKAIFDHEPSMEETKVYEVAN